MAGPKIRVTTSVNRVLWPRLAALGFRLHFAEDGPRWKEGAAIDRTGPTGQAQGLLMGRDKFGHRFGLNISKQLPDGKFEWLNLETLGIPYSSLTYKTQEELDVLLRRLADAFESHIVPWLDAEPHG